MSTSNCYFCWLAAAEMSDSTCCSCRILCIFKYLFHIFNLLCLVSGISIIFFGVWSVLSRPEYLVIHENYIYPMIMYVFLGIGLVIFLTSIVGYIGVWKEDKCTIIYYIFLLLTVFLIETILGVLSFTYNEQINAEISVTLNHTFARDYYVNAERTAAIDHIQSQMKCCGVNTFEEWRYSVWYLNITNQSVPVPDSCCITPSTQCGKSTHPSNIYYAGCTDAIAQQTRHNLYIIEVATITMGSLLFFSVILSFGLCLNIKKHLY